MGKHDGAHCGKEEAFDEDLKSLGMSFLVRWANLQGWLFSNPCARALAPLRQGEGTVKPWKNHVKRFLDISGSGGILICAPVLIGTAAAIKLSMGSPIPFWGKDVPGTMVAHSTFSSFAP